MVSPYRQNDDDREATVRVEDVSAGYDVELVVGTPSALAKVDDIFATLRRRVLGSGERIDDGVMLRLETIETVADAVMRLVEEKPKEGEAIMDVDGTGPTDGDVRKAIRTLLASSASSRRSQWEHALDALVACPTLDADQLYQAYRHAERKRWLLVSTRLLGAADLARLMPDRVDTDRNTARVLARLREEGEILAVRVKRDWKYPAAQLNGRGEVHAVLPDLLRRATARGYDEWEIFYWLAASGVEVDEVVPGRPLDDIDENASFEEIASLAATRHAADVPTSRTMPSPFEMLERSDDVAFEQAARRWLED